VDSDLTLVNAVVFDGESADLVEGTIRIAGGRVVEGCSRRRATSTPGRR
jgi:hypothetical protein